MCVRVLFCILLDLSFNVHSAFRRGSNSTFVIIASPPTMGTWTTIPIFLKNKICIKGKLGEEMSIRLGELGIQAMPITQPKLLRQQAAIVKLSS